MSTNRLGTFLGSGPDPFAPKAPPALTAEQLRRLATLDPTNPIERGRLTAMRRATTITRQRDIIDRMLARPVQPPARAADRWWTRNASHAPVEPKPLSASDLAWLQRLPTDPDKMSREDVQALALLSAQVADKKAVPGSDARLIDSYYAPVVAHLDRQARIAELTAIVGDRNARPAPPAPSGSLPGYPDPLVEELADLEEANAQAQLAAARAAGQPLDDVVIERRAIVERVAGEVKAERDAAAAAASERRTAALAELKTLEAS